MLRNAVIALTVFAILIPSVLFAKKKGTAVFNVQVVSTVNVSCYGQNTGSATISFSDGSPAYFYSLNGGPYMPVSGSPFTISGLVANSYTVTVKDGGANTVSANFSIDQPLAPLTLGPCSKTDATCYGTSTGSVTAGTVSNAVGTVHYQWTKATPVIVGTTATVNNLPSNMYVLTVTDDCSSQSCIVIVGQPNEMNATVTSANGTCNGTNNGSITISNPVGGPEIFEYSINAGTSWQTNGIYTGLAAGTYPVQMRDANNPVCVKDLGNWAITRTGTAPTVAISVSAPAFCSNILLTANPSQAVSYLWTGGETTATKNLSIANPDGIYNVYVTNANGCTGTASYNYIKQHLLGSYTILGLKDVMLGQTNIVNGAVGNTAAGKKVAIDKNSTVNGFVKASVISLTPPVTVTGGTIIGPVGVTLPSMQFNTAIVPAANYTVPDNATQTITANFNNLTIGKAATVTVSGSIYGNIVVREGAKVTFTQPVIDINNINTDAGKLNVNYTTMNFNGPTVRIRNKVIIGDRNRVNGSNTTFYMGDAIADILKFTVNGNDTKLTANVYMTHGLLSVPGTLGLCIMTGKFIAEDISSNNMVTWNGYDCNSAPPASFASPVNSIVLVEEMNERPWVVEKEDALKVMAYPIPSAGDFNIRVQTSSNEPITVRIMDMNGVVKGTSSQLLKGNTFKVGANLNRGTYMAEITQGKNRQVVKLVKLN